MSDYPDLDHLANVKVVPPPVDYSLMGGEVSPIAGPGSEVWGVTMGWCHCGLCGYTGRVLGPKQAGCPQRDGWHRWLNHCADTYAA